MWTGLNVRSFLIENKKIPYLMTELKKNHWVSEKHENDQTIVIIGGSGYFTIDEREKYSLVSIPYHSIVSFNSGLILILVLVLLADFTLIGGLVFLGLAAIISYWKYSTYESRIKTSIEIIKKYDSK